MKRTTQKPFGAMLLLLITSLLWFGCGDDNGTSPGPVSQDQEKADSIVTVANDSMATLMDEVINQTVENADSSFRPQDIDFTDLYNMYKAAYNLDPTNNDARFGTAFCGLMSFLASPGLNDLYDEVKTDFDNNDFNPFNPGRMIPRILAPAKELPRGIPAKPGRIVEFLPNIVALNSNLTAYASTDSTMSRLQGVIETDLMPLLVEARTHLQAIIATEPPFTFTITPEMQGNDGAQQIIIDRSDFQLFLGAVRAFEAVLHVFLARNLDLDIWSMNSLESDINKGSDFLKLRSGNHMPQAKTGMLAAADAFYTAVDYFIAEIGTSQTYDLIPVYADDMADLLDIQDGIDEFKDYFEGSREVEITYNEQCYWVWEEPYYYYYCEEDTLNVMVDISQLFDNPVADLKELLPDYTVTLDEVNDIYKSYADEHFSPTRYWANLQTYFGVVYPNDTSLFPTHLPDDNTSDLFYELIRGDYNDYHFVLGWDDVSGYGDYIYYYWSAHMWDYNNYYNNPDQIAVCFSWTANSFDEWTWPNPTFNNLFPLWTSDEIKNIMQDNGIDWTKSSCDTFSLDF